MNEKFTPGPWKIRKYKDPYGRRNLAVEILTDEIIIAKLGIEIDEECAANAYLVAAAPEMYTALKKTCSNALELGYCTELHCAACKNMAALKKARGES